MRNRRQCKILRVHKQSSLSVSLRGTVCIKHTSVVTSLNVKWCHGLVTYYSCTSQCCHSSSAHVCVLMAPSCRLLILGVDKWVHLNCALWSYEVYETMNGALVNVDAACKRGLTLPCTACSDPGATVGCFKPRCTNIYHVTCAQKAGVMFFQDKV